MNKLELADTKCAGKITNETKGNKSIWMLAEN